MWPLFLAWRQLFPPGRFPVFASVSILGVAFGVAALLVVQSVMNSFGEEHRRRVRESYGDVVLRIPNSTAPLELLESPASLPGVAAVAPYIEGNVVLLPDDDKLQFLRVRGIDPEKEGQVTPLGRYFASTNGAGSLDALDDERVIIGSQLARTLSVGMGDFIEVQSVAKIRQMFDGKKRMPLKRLEVCGIIHTGFTPADANVILITLRAARDLFGVSKGYAEASHMRLVDHRQAPAVAKEINGNLGPPFVALPGLAFRAVFLEAVEMEKQMLFFLMFIITLVASFSIGSTLFSHVVRRTREIGLLGALGAQSRQILRLFLAQGVIIGILGYGIGTGFAVLLLHFRQEIVRLFGAEETMSKQYMFDSVPLHYNPDDFLKAAALTLFLMTIVSLLPAFWAARRKPSEAMRDVG
ncbi:MAG: ABC transporter permease [Puniceicoccales bacterium]|nr:ABC transporter permease [Puniceicoccales bacterium]